MERPLLYLDVDGPLNPYAAKPERRPEGYATYRMKPEGWIAQHPGEPRAYVKPLRVWLNGDHGTALRKLSEAYDVVWATTWEAEANTFVSPVLGLPELPVVTWPSPPQAEPDGTFWKTRPLLAHAGGRPFAWVDDELGERDRAFVASHHRAPTLLRRIDPRYGLRDDDFAALEAFACLLTAPTE
ncbi:HAD domain-containing protein [Streptomyces sp. NPDC002132]|uniref:HAD domain-containing protein n=1 Tax=unclassified Streptomyces TaxID=2593676 RepID=UPI00332D35B4